MAQPPDKNPAGSVTKIALLTGASGFIGRALLPQLLAAGYQVNSLSRTDSDSEADPRQGWQHFQGDILDYAAVLRAARGATAGADQDSSQGELTVFHLASIAHVYGAPEADLARVIVEGTRTVLKAAIDAGARRLIYFSSILAQPETASGLPATAYGRAKRQAESLLQAAQDKLEIVILRPVNVYGPGMQGNLQRLIERIGARRLPPLPKLTTRMPLISVQDLCQFAMLAAEAPQAAGNTYTVSDGETYRINELESAIYAAWGRSRPAWHTPRVVLFGAALTMELLGLISPQKRGLGLRTYRNLVHEQPAPEAEAVAAGRELGFRATTDFYRQLPALIQATTKH